MSEFFDDNEATPYHSRVEHAAEYLQGRLERLGSLEALVLAMQHDYSGDQILHQSSAPEKAVVPIFGEPIDGPVLGESGVTYEDSINTGQLYQLLRISELLSRATLPGKEVSPSVVHSLYAGELIAMNVIDFMTSHENNVPAGLLGTLHKRLFDEWETYTHGFDFSPSNGREVVRDRIWVPLDDQHMMREHVATSILNPAQEFSELPMNSELKELINSLLEGSKSPHVLLVERGFWVIMREWLDPDYRQEAATHEALREASRVPVSSHVLEGLAASARYGLSQPQPAEVDPDSIWQLEAQFDEDDLEADPEEWNRQSLNDVAKDLVYRASRIRVAGQALRAAGDASPEDEDLERVRIEIMLDTYARNEHELVDDDLIYAHGTFVGLAAGDIGSDSTRAGDTDADDAAFLYQMLDENDYYSVVKDPAENYIPVEVRGLFKGAVIMGALSNKDSYTVDINDDEAVDACEVDLFTPGIYLQDVTIINMETGEAMHVLDSLEIPLTHSRLELGRFVPPPSDD